MAGVLGLGGRNPLPDRKSLQTEDFERSWNLQRVPVSLHGSDFTTSSRANSAVPSSKRLRETLERLASLEERAFATEFLAPMIRGGMVQVRIAGVVCRLRVEP